MELVQLPNGEVVDLWSYGVPDDCPTDFQEVSFENSMKLYSTYMHAAHGLIYSRSDEVLWGKFKRHAMILMQMRSEGNLGFGGGLLDKGYHEDVVDCLNREYHEEFNLNLEKCAFTSTDHIISNVKHKKKFVTHFYAHEVSEELFLEIEKNAVFAKDWGTETFGILRVPLFVVDSDNLRGLPVFLANQFSGCAKEQLIETIKRKNLLPESELKFALEQHKKYTKSLALCSDSK